MPSCTRRRGASSATAGSRSSPRSRPARPSSRASASRDQAHGDAREGMGKAAKRVTAEYPSRNVARACMEPINGTARVDGERIELWAPTQSPFGVVLAAVKARGFKPDNVKINVTLLGG